MATTPGFAEDLSRETVAIFESVERLLIQKMATNLAKGLDTPGWQQAQLASIRAYLTYARQLLANSVPSASVGALQAIRDAYQYGDLSAAAEIGEALGATPAPGLLSIATQNIAALAAETVAVQTSTHFQILRKVEDSYRSIIAEAVQAPLTGVETRRTATQRALNRFASEGITVASRAGRNYQLTAYVEMSMRTTLMNATLQGHAQRLERNGIDLVIVSDHAQECKHCRPYEGKVLSMSGNDRGMIEVTSVKSDKTVKVEVFASLQEARRGGLFHPQCRHTYAAYLPGVTRSFGVTADPQGDKDRQKLRRLERETRALRHVEAAALDEKAAKEARDAVRAKQAQIREHVANTSAKRQPERERITGNFR